MIHSSQKHIFLILLVTIFIFGIGWPINKMGLEYMPPISFAASRLVIATLFMFIIVALSHNFIWPSRKDLNIILVIGLFQIGLFVLFINVGMSFVEVGRSMILVYTTPIWVTPIAALFFKETLGLFKSLGLLFGIIGIIILFGPNALDWQNPQEITGNIFLILAAVTWAISILCAKYMDWQHSTLQLFPWQLLVGTLFVVPVAIFFEPALFIPSDTKFISILLFVSIFPQTLGACGALIVSRALPSITTSLSLLAVPVLGIIFSYFMLHEPISLHNTIAMVFIFTGLIFTALDQKRMQAEA